MEALELLEIVERGEDSKHQFKQNVESEISLAQEMVAFSNSDGGKLIIGVSDVGIIEGLTDSDIRRINLFISNAATNHIKNPINVKTEILKVDDKNVIVVFVELGIDKPYFDKDGVVWVKNGADKRKVTSREELRRMFQSSDLISSDKISVEGSSINDIDEKDLANFYLKEYNEEISNLDISLIDYLQNSSLAKDGKLYLGGLLLFGKNPEKFKPEFLIKAVSFFGNEDTESKYHDSEDINGNLLNQYKNSINFVKRNLIKVQNDQNFNSLGEMEIPELVFQEILVNALIHRNYFIASSIRLFMFNNRIEIISPGSLPNSLTIESIKSGISIVRNPILVSFGTKILPYRGIGTGVRRAIKNYPDIEFINDTENNQFKVIILRPESS